MQPVIEDFNTIFNEYQQGQREARRNEETAPSRPETRKTEAQPNNEAIRERDARMRAESERDALRADIDRSERREMEKRGDYQGLLERERADRQREKEAADHWVAETTRKAIDPEVRRLAKKLGLIDLADTARLDLSHVTVRNDGSVTGLGDAFETLRKAKPHYFRAGTSEPLERGERGRFVARPRIVSDTPSDYSILAENRSAGDWNKKSSVDFSNDMRRQFGVNI